MTSYVLSRDAVQDLEDIQHPLLIDAGPGIAAKNLGELRSAVRPLSRRPELGHRRSDLTDEAVKSWRVLSYPIVYDPSARPVAIARIIDSRRHVGRVLQSRR